MDRKIENERQIIRIKNLRNIANLSQRSMAEKYGIPLRTWEDWESGRRRMPDYLLRLLCYKVNMDFIFHTGARHDDSCGISVVSDCDGNKIVMINDILFKGRKNVDWDVIEQYLKKYIGLCVPVIDTDDLIYISKDFPDEFAHSKDTKILKGANLYAKANSSVAIRDMVSIANNKTYTENYDSKHKDNAKYGWYRYDTRFALPKYNSDNEISGYNVFKARLIVRHVEDGKMYLYDVLRTKKETSKPLEQ